MIKKIPSYSIFLWKFLGTCGTIGVYKGQKETYVARSIFAKILCIRSSNMYELNRPLFIN